MVKIDPGQWGINQLTSLDLPGLSRQPGVIHRGSNSGYQAVNLAYLLGATRIILLGFDMMMTGSSRHWFGAHPPGMEVASDYRDFANKFKSIRPSDYGIEIWNCSRRTALDQFPIYNLDEVYESLD
jgi:hypothetical protein